MLHRQEFSKFTSALAHVCFSDNVVLALARTLRDGSVPPDDRRLLEDTQQFFASVLTGYAWSETPVLSRRSVQAAAAFANAVHAFPVAPPEDFRTYIEQLRLTATRILDQGTAPEPDIRRLQNFFTQAGYQQLERFNGLVSEKPAYAKWRPSATL
jgi:hypothetical protein